ncbi:MAG: 4Fe-4S ferredoxin, partial [Muribaculaceae bacterium]|nr:4Fe-4S ferredoxin [Muribaculaceae bacterium]
MIVCFTGTGNSGAVALRLSRALDDELVMLRGDLLICATPELVLSGDRVVWVFPTYSWGVPPVVADFIGRVAIE